MDLFDEPLQKPIGLLPEDGDVYYHGVVLPRCEADQHLTQLLQEVEWKPDEAVVFGKRIITRRKVAWYGDKPFSYSYSNTTKTALPWTPQLLIIKSRVELQTGESFNSCLLNLYHDGSEGMATPLPPSQKT